MSFPTGRVRNLSSIVRFMLKLLKLVSGLLASKTSERLTPAERNAVIALQMAIDALLILLPSPGDDDDPSTPE